jgi:GGDEF domain-containing protein
MANQTPRYTASFFSVNGSYVVQKCSTKAQALRAAHTISATLLAAGAKRTQVRVATGAGTLVTYAEVGDPMINQEQYNTIRMFVSAGHALHPEQAKELLDSFEELLRAADLALDDSRHVALSVLMYDESGAPRLILK